MPTPLRTTHRDWANPHPNLKEPTEILIKTSYGPIGRCVEDLVLVLKSWWDKNFWKYDAYVIPKPFNTKSYEKMSNKKLRIAYFDDNQVFPCAEVVKSVIRETVNKLKNDGHELVEMNTDFFAHAFEYASRLFFGIDPSIIVDELQGESPTFPFKPQYISSECSISSMFEPAALSMSGYHQLAEALNAPRIYTLKEFCVFAEQVCLFKSEFTDYWNQMGFDCVICPVWPLVAPQHNKTEYLFPAFSYLYFWNIMSFPAGVVPVRKVKKGEDIYNATLNDGSAKIAKEIMKDSVGLPVAIQVAGFPNSDEKVLGVMKLLENYYDFHEYPL
ncbi:unnamed protein product [Blepharisma stoltei]|uniref:Amidase domain-containing protein n=1 Tax=Blepharisma stoltei TaxID=1481888 RepID=A0AAU9K816_9CILI|nr:unnamed protein product [Blepharisma stoltei]